MLQRTSLWRATGRGRHLTNLRLAVAGFWFGLMDGRKVGYQIPGLVAAIVLGLVRDASVSRWLAIVIVVTLVFAAKVANTIAERLCELVLELHTGSAHTYNKSVKLIKDMGAGLLLSAKAGALVVGLIVLISPA